jgi:hypothetical protein
MDSEEKVNKAKKINDLLSKFVENLGSELGKTNHSMEYLKGYEQCAQDILADLDNDSPSSLTMLIRARVEHNAKIQIYSEILSGLNAINDGFKKVL